MERRLGAGGFGVVWLAWDEKLEREVAVKVIPRERGVGERVEREARAAARLNHPGIVAIYELASDEHDVYLVSELVRGRTLAELTQAGALSDRDVARIGAALCEALEHAHARGVIHRDVKPGNVMVLAEPAAGAGFAKLADFGVAHVASGDPLTRTGDVVGTLAYMAPEQAEGVRVTSACDVYSLALTLYEAWTGTNPVKAQGPAATARRLGRPLPSLAGLRRDLPLELCDVVDDALEIDPARRPLPAKLREALRAAESELGDDGGLVEPATLRRVGLATTAQRRSLLGLWEGDEPAGDERTRLRVPERAAAGMAGGGLVLGCLLGLGPDPSFSPLAAAAIAAVAIAVLPRVGWLLAVIGLCGWLVSPEADRQGTALLVAAAAAPIPFLLPRAGLLWSVPIAAPLLGTIALAPAFIGAAALASTPARRAGLAAASLWWVLLGEAATGHALLFGSPDGTLPRANWQGSISAAVSDGLGPLVTSPALAPVVVWAAGAVLLALVVRGRWLAVDLLGAAACAAALIAAHVALGDALAANVALDHARGGIAGSIAAALVLLARFHLGPGRELRGGSRLARRPPRVTTA
ncbi:MAG TPA: serine/threonine-protein kinase [Thermoleophilaceae bacterium]|nr:serine/threonine-protein kinase [Thermoleophilaceae bacterium]